MDCQFIHINGQLVKRFMFRDYLGYICYIDCKDGKVFCIGRKDDFEQCTSSIHPRRFREIIIFVEEIHKKLPNITIGRLYLLLKK